MGFLIISPITKETDFETKQSCLLPGLASASSWADLLIFSDLLSHNLKFLRDSLDNPRHVLPSLAFVADLEGCTSDQVKVTCFYYS